MNREDLIKLVNDTSLYLMNSGDGDGTICHCYDDDDIIEEFSGLTEAQVIRKVHKMDRATADHFNEVRMFSGEYKMLDGVAVSIYELEQLEEINQQTNTGRNTL